MLVETRGWEPWDEDEPVDPPRPRGLWRPLAWITAFIWLLVIALEVDGFAGYGIFLVAIALGSWRLDRWAGKLEFGRKGDSGAWY